MTRLQFATILSIALGSALVGGVFFAFSSLVMPALARSPGDSGFLAMRQINVAVFGSTFLWLMFGILIPMIASLFFISSMPGRTAFWLVSGVVIYLAGSIAVTIFFNVPLNDRLMAASPDDHLFWSSYVGSWTAWNSLRAIASIVSAFCAIMAIASSAPDLLAPAAP